jgi:hypothetical protein
MHTYILHSAHRVYLCVSYGSHNKRGCFPKQRQSQNRSHITTDGQSASLSWCQAPSWAQDQIFVTVRQLRIRWCGAPFLMRAGVCRLQLLLALAGAVIVGCESRWTHNHILLPQIRHSSNLEGQVPVFISPRNRVTQLYSQALGSLFVASYDSQCYGGGIQTCLHTGVP